MTKETNCKRCKNLFAECTCVIDPVKIVEELKRREDSGFEGRFILRFRKHKGIVSLREEYDVPNVTTMTAEDVNKYYGRLMNFYKMYGKCHISFVSGNPRKLTIERQLSLDKFYL